MALVNASMSPVSSMRTAPSTSRATPEVAWTSEPEPMISGSRGFRRTAATLPPGPGVDLGGQADPEPAFPPTAGETVGKMAPDARNRYQAPNPRGSSAARRRVLRRGPHLDAIGAQGRSSAGTRSTVPPETTGSKTPGFESAT